MYSAAERTFDAGILDRQIELEILVAGLHVHEVLVEDAQTAGAPTGTVRVDDVDDVVGAADVSEVLAHALAQIHAPVARALHQHQLARRLAFGAEVFRLADDVFGCVYKSQGYVQGRRSWALGEVLTPPPHENM